MDLKRSVMVLAAAAALSGPACAQAPDAFLNLPRQEAPGRQIGWFANQTMDAFVKAVETNRPVILVVGDANSKFTQAFAKQVTPCPHLNQLAGAAVFAYGSPSADEFARRIAVHLKLTVFPTITVLAPRTDKLTELYRLEGFFDARTAAEDLRKALVASNYAKDLAAPKTLPSHYLAYPGLACTPQGAKRLGFPTDYSPEP